MCSSDLAQAIRQACPHAKIVMILRNPIEVAFSLYCHSATGGHVTRSFSQQLQISLQPRAKFGVLSPHLEYGLFAAQVERYLSAFPRHQIRIYFYDDHRHDFRGLFADLCGFLGVDASFVPDFSERAHSARIPRMNLGKLRPLVAPFIPRALKRRFYKKPVLTDADRAVLRGYYAADIGRLSSLLNRELSHWLQ